MDYETCIFLSNSDAGFGEYRVGLVLVDKEKSSERVVKHYCTCPDL